MLRSRLVLFVLGAAISLVALAFVFILPKRGSATPEAGVAWRTEEETRTIEVYKRAKDAVVFISTVTLTVDPSDWFSEVQPEKGTGSGLVIDAERGIIVTNLHVIQNAQGIEIMLGNGEPAQAKLLGYDQEYDIAVLQLIKPLRKLVSLPFGDSSKLEVGQRVLAIGNPFALNRTLTTGIVSSLDRSVKSSTGVVMKGLIQTDAAINPGNSGGPLLDSEGRLIGINTAILSQSGDSAGIGFAVPINPIKRILPELIATGKVARPNMGWILVDTTEGVMVRRVMPGGPAEQAGIAPIERAVENVYIRGFVRDFNRADLILAVNGRNVVSRDQVDEIVAASAPGTPLEVTLRRGGIEGRQRKVTLSPVLK